MKVQPALVAAAIGRLVTSTHAPDVGDGVRSVIDICERESAHPDWAALRAIDWTADAEALRVWFDRVLAAEPPEAPLRGLYFALCQPMMDSGGVTTDMQCVGTAEYDANDRSLEWLFSRHYFPEAYAESAALHQLYGIAYGTYSPVEQVDGVLGNDAEWPVGLAYAVLAARMILECRSVSESPATAGAVGVAAGWGGGDMVLIGELTEVGFVPVAEQTW